MRPASTLPILMTVALFSGASAQTPTPAQPLQPVDPQHADINPLRTSTRDMRPDLRVPTGFDRVYRVPGSMRGVDGAGSGALGTPRFERVSGGLTAVFTASEYAKDKDGKTLPSTPVGTVYYIGGVPAQPGPPNPPRRTSPLAAINRVSLFIDTLDERTATPNRAAIRADYSFDQTGAAQPTLAPGAPPAPRGAPATTTAQPTAATSEARPAGSMLIDDGFRRARIRSLLQSAADAASGERSGSRSP